MKRRTFRVVTASVTALLLATVVLGTASAHGRPSERRDLFKALAGTVRFHSTRLAEKAGYGPFPVGVPLHECVENLSGPGAMGFHWINGTLLTTDLDPARPQVLVYAPDRHGGLDLVALEYVVFKDAWDSAHPGTMPSLFGEEFMETPAPNRYEIPAFYALHVWLYRYNPAGLFAPFNPRVSCQPGRTGHAASATGTTLFDCMVPKRRSAST